MEGLKNNQAIETSGGCCRRAISRKGRAAKEQTFENKRFRAIGVAKFANRGGITDNHEIETCIRGHRREIIAAETIRFTLILSHGSYCQ